MIFFKKISRQHPALHQFAQSRLELDRQNAQNVDVHMRQHLERVTELAKRLNPEIDSDAFRAKGDYTEKRLFWTRIEQAAQEAQKQSKKSY